MGKKPRTASGKQRAALRKLNKKTLPEPPPPVEDEIGSLKIVQEPAEDGNKCKLLDRPGYDDGGVGDLSLIVDLEDNVARRQRGDVDYFSAVKANRLPRDNNGPFADKSRRDQKVQLATLLFTDDATPGEVFSEQSLHVDDPAELAVRQDQLSEARAALRLGMVLGDYPAVSVGLIEISKRNLLVNGKGGAEDSMRCVNKALEVAGDGFWDGDDILLEASDEYNPPTHFEKNATTPGLSNPASLKYMSLRVSQLCLRSAWLQKANVLAAQGKEEEARKSYQSILPLLVDEHRCSRIDWERVSLLVNIGNTYARTGDFNSADEQYELAEKIGMEHLNHEHGSREDGELMVSTVKRARAFALARNGREVEAKAIIKELIDKKLSEEKKKKVQASDTQNENIITINE